MFAPNQRVKVNLANLTIQGVQFSQNVQEALGTVLEQISTDPPTYRIELLFSFKGVKRVEVPEERIRRSELSLSFVGTLLSSVFLCLLVVCPPGPAWATPPERFSFENADIHTIVEHVGRLTGITFLFDPEQVKGRITLLSPKSVSPVEALELLKSALALHGYTLLSRAEGIWIVPAERLAREAVTVKVVPLNYARPGELAYTLSWVVPPWVRIIPY